MKKLIALGMAVALGAGLMYMAMHFHVVRMEDGHHWIAKQKPALGAAYVDVREYTLSDWQQQEQLVENILASDDEALKGQAISGGLSNTAQQVLQGALDKFGQ